jgi:uncharacterized protein (TIGR01777 family)
VSLNIIILGGSGLIGKAFAQELLANGHSVWILSRRPQQVDTLPGASVRVWDGRSSIGWMDLVEQSDAVVNLAGESIGAGRWTEERKRLILVSRKAAGQAVVEAVSAASRKPAVVMQSSAVGYYGPAENIVFNEDSTAGKDFLAGVAKQWEASTQAVEAFGVRRIVIRTGVVLDARAGILGRFVLPFKLFCGGPMGSGRQMISWIHIQDQAQAMRFLLEKDVCGVFNLCAPQAVSNAEFGKEIAHALDRPYWLPAPGFALRLALGELSTLVLDGQQVVPARLRQAGYSFVYPQLAAALADLLHRNA